MTTKVTVDAHAGWDLKVTLIDGREGEEQTQTEIIVPAHTVQDFYVHDGRRIRVEEVPRP